MAAPHKFVAFDIETARCDGPTPKPEELQVTCAATVTHEAEVRLWHPAETAEGAAYESVMDPERVRELIDYLYDLYTNEVYVVSWNGLRFDFCVLANAARDELAYQRCAEMALYHIDIMFDVFCVKGFPVGLDAAASGLGVGGKLQGMSGSLAPDLWEQGRDRQDLVLKYVRQDALLTAKVLLAIYRRGWFQWRARSGNIQQAALPMVSGRLMTVCEALKLPEPDVSWMDSPMTRESFYLWTLPESARPDEAEVTEIPTYMTQLTLDISRNREAAIAAWLYALMIADKAPGEASELQEALIAHWPSMAGSADEVIKGLTTHHDVQD